MATQNFEDAAAPAYNIGVLRVPGQSTGDGLGVQFEQLFADLLPNKDIVGGQVAKGFIGLLGQPLVETGTVGVYEAAAAGATKVAGLLLLSVNAYDAPREINVVKGGTVKTTVGALKGLDAAALKTLATALGGVYDSTFKTIKF